MLFGPISLDSAYGAILAHAMRLPEKTLKKGHRIDTDDLDLLRQSGITTIVAARLEPDDLHEDDAANHIAKAVAGSGIRIEEPFTGRVNLHAETAGLLLVDRNLVDRLNRVDPAITFATLPERTAVEAGRMVATVKIIPFAVGRSKVFDALHRIGEHGTPVELLGFKPMRVGVVSTILPGLKPTTVEKTLKALRDRLAPSGSRVVADMRPAHESEALSRCLSELTQADVDLIVIFGASAIIDPADVIPDALERAGGETIHFGMPVDPGNLLLIGNLSGKPVLGAPGCARSPRENGFDWILARILAGLNVTAEDITGMGVGGLLMDIVSRPRPRDLPVAEDADDDKPGIAAVILAAGRARRMGGPNKLLAEFDGIPQIRRIAEAALTSRADHVIVVTGHRSAALAEALEGLDVHLVHNPDYPDGLSGSLRSGIAAVPGDADGALVILSDMPGLAAGHLNALIDAHDPASGGHIVVATAAGKRGNPVLWSRRFFGSLKELSGDVGAKHLITAYPESVVEVEIGDAAFVDIDTPDALAAAGGRLPDAGG